MDASKIKEATDIRATLRFPEAVTKHFAFFEKWGLNCIHAESTIVRYSLNGVNVNIFIGRHSFMIDAEFQKHNSDLMFYFIDLLRLFSCPEATTYRCYQATTAESVSRGVEILSNIFRRRLTVDMLTDNTLFSRLGKQREENARAWYRRMEVERLRLQLANAWEKRDYRAIVGVSSRIDVTIWSQTEKLKIDYAKKRLFEHK